MLRKARQQRARLLGAHSRIRRHARGVRLRPWRMAIALSVVLALVAGVVFLVGYSRAFTAQAVEVAGTSDAAMTQRVLVNASIPQGRPLARVDTAAVAAAVMEDPRIATVDVGRSWPSTITVEVTLRQPAVAITRPGAKLTLADAEGVLYEQAKKAPKGVPTISAARGDVAPESVQGALAMLDSLPPKYRRNVSKVAIAADGAVRFSHRDDRVIWGDGSQPLLKSRVLVTLLEQPAVKDADAALTLDLSIPGTPVVTGLPTPPEN